MFPSDPPTAIPTEETNWRRDTPFVMAGIAVCFLLFYRYWPIFSDHSLFHYIAFGMTQGLKPYADLYEHNFPLIYAIHALALRISGSDPFGLRLIDTAFLVVTTLSMSAILAGFGAGRTLRMLCATAWILSYFFGGFSNTAQREAIGLTFAAVGCYAWADAISKKPQGNAIYGNTAFFLSGAAMAAAIWTKPTLITMGAPAVMLVLWLCRRTPKIWFRLAAFTAGGLAASSIGILWLWKNGILNDFYIWAVDFAFFRYGSWHYPRNELLLYMLRNITTRNGAFSTLLLIVATVIVVFKKGRRTFALLAHPAVLLGIALCAGNALSMYVQGKGMPYHAVPLNWSITLTAGLLLSVGASATIKRHTSLCMLICGFTGLISIASWSIIGRIQPMPEYFRPWSFQPMQGTLLARTLAPLLADDETLVLFDGSAHTLLAELKRISPFPYVDGAYYILAGTPPDSELSNTVLDNLDRSLHEPSVRMLVVENMAGLQVHGIDDSTQGILNRHKGVMGTINTLYRLNESLSSPQFSVYNRLYTRL